MAKHFNNSILIILAFLTLTACGESKEQDLTKTALVFPKTINLEPREILPNEIGIIEVNAIDTLLFLSVNGKDHFFHIYNTDYEFLGKLGKKGFGPTEYQAPVLIKNVEKEDNELFIWINDKFRYTFTRVNLTQTIAQQKTVIDRKIELEPELALSQEVEFLNDSVVIGNMGIESLSPYRLRFYNLNSGDTHITEDLPKINQPRKIKLGDYYQLFYSYIGMHPNGEKVVSALNYFNRLDIIDVKSGSTLELVTEGNQHSEFNAATRVSDGQLLNLHNYYFDIDVTEELIFALYYNQPDSEYGDRIIPTQIRVFDWEGQPKLLIKVPDYLMNISIDKERKVMYGADYYNEKIYQYNLETIF